MSHIWMSHGKHWNELWHTWQWVMAHNGISYRSHRTGSWRTWESVIAYICTFIYTHIYIYIHIYTYVHVYKCIYTYMYIYIYYICIYIFVCVNISIYICISIYTKIYAQRTHTRRALRLKARVGPSRYSEVTTSHDAKCFAVKWFGHQFAAFRPAKP
jgi:hypothetical protein